MRVHIRVFCVSAMFSRIYCAFFFCLRLVGRPCRERSIRSAETSWAIYSNSKRMIVLMVWSTCVPCTSRTHVANYSREFLCPANITDTHTTRTRSTYVWFIIKKSLVWSRILVFFVCPFRLCLGRTKSDANTFNLMRGGGADHRNCLVIGTDRARGFVFGFCLVSSLLSAFWGVVKSDKYEGGNNTQH